MYDLELTQEPEMCHDLKNWVKDKVYQSKVHLQTIIEKSKLFYDKQQIEFAERIHSHRRIIAVCWL